MTWPPKSVMDLLLDICAGQEIDPVDGILTTVRDTPRGPKRMTYDNDELDALESRGWITLDGPTAKATDKGYYAIERFIEKVTGKRIDARRAQPSGKPGVIIVGGERW